MSLSSYLFRLREKLTSSAQCADRSRRLAQIMGKHLCRVEMLESRRMLSVVALTAGSGQISGSVWNDLDADGLWGTEEPGVSGWQVYLDSNGDGVWNTGEKKATTDINGDYSFTNLAAGTYYVRSIQQTDWNQTSPYITESVTANTSGGPLTASDIVSESSSTEASLPEDDIIAVAMDSPPTPPTDYFDLPKMQMASSTTPVLLDNVPTSTWTYGCSATAGGMIFGYYDLHGYDDMYTGPTNGGVVPLTNLGQGYNVSNPIAGSCSIIATQNGFDGRTTDGHVDDYWISVNSDGPDPYVTAGTTEHVWGDCVADFMGTNQWKWDFDYVPGLDRNIDGSTTLYFSASGSKTYDYIPSASYGTPQTALSHGLRLFAESRGYIVLQNYTQAIDTYATSGGFTFADYMAEIDAGRPVMVQLDGHSMVGMGYDESTQTVYVHDTWSNIMQSMSWGGSYKGMEMQAITVIILAPVGDVPGTHVIELTSGQQINNANFGYQFFGSVPEIQVCYVNGLVNVLDNDVSPTVAEGTDFEVSGLGKSGITRTFRVYNIGMLPLTTEGLTVPEGMTVLDSLDAEIAPRSYDEFIVQIDTDVLGDVNGSIQFFNNDGDEGTYNFLVTSEVIEMGSPQLYVDASAPAEGDGQSWETAFNSIQEAMAEAIVLNQDNSLYNDIDAIWIAEGTYTPTHSRQGVAVLADADLTNDRTATFAMLDGIALVGGFAGNETTVAERIYNSDGTWKYETILSGDLGLLENSLDNAYTVIYSGIDVNTKIDGLTITNGSTQGSTSTNNEFNYGAGIYLYAGELTVANCHITENIATNGAGIYSMGYLTVINSIISDNTASGEGGGICINDVYLGATEIVNSLIVNNTANIAGAIHRSYGNLKITSSTIAGNSATATFGGIFDSVRNAGDETILNNNIIAGNFSPFAGVNDVATFSENVTGSNNLIGDATLLTSWTNGVNGNLLGTTESPLDPKFVNPAAGNYRLSVTSPAINAGNNTLAIGPDDETIFMAIDGISRVVYDTVDMGAYEFRLTGDANLDGMVDGSDVTILAGNWQATNASWGKADFNGDGRVDGSDVTILAGNWQATLPQTQQQQQLEEPITVVEMESPTESSVRQTTFTPPTDLQPGLATVTRPETAKRLRPVLVDLVLVDLV